jgi:hypothetical protein
LDPLDEFIVHRPAKGPQRRRIPYLSCHPAKASGTTFLPKENWVNGQGQKYQSEWTKLAQDSVQFSLNTAVESSGLATRYPSVYV